MLLAILLIVAVAESRKNTAVLVSSSIGYYNYRQAANLLSVYQHLKGFGYKDRAIARKRTPLKNTDLAVNPSSPEKVGDKKKIKNDRNNEKNNDKSETVVPLTLPPWTTGQIPRYYDFMLFISVTIIFFC